MLKRLRLRREWLALIPLGALVLFLLAGLATGGRTSIIEVSGASPFRSCEFEAPVFNPNSHMTLDSEVEPSLAVDPTDRQVVIGVYQQDRWSGGQARGIAGSVSHDGGQTWQQVALPFSRCAKSSVTSLRAGDPWVSFGGDGTAYVIATGTGIAVSVSNDGGLTWGDPAALDERTEGFFPDKPTISADQAQPGVAYAVWARILTETTYDAMFAKTIDFGRTWSSPEVLIEHAADGGAVSSQILVDPEGGALYHLTNWEEGVIGQGGRARVLIQRSADGGKTWSDPETAFDNRTLGYGAGGANGFSIRTAVEVPDFAIAPTDGTLYATWQDGRFSGGLYDQVAFSSSTDGGTTWSDPRKLNATASDLAGIPMVAVSSSGAIAVSYYSFHAALAGEGPRLEARVFLAESSDRGKSFTTTELAGPVDLRSAPQSLATGEEGEFAFLGDYAGLDALGSDFAVLFALPNPARNDPADVFLATRVKRFPQISMPPAAASIPISPSAQPSRTPAATAPSLDSLAGGTLTYASQAGSGPASLYRSALDGSDQRTIVEIADTWIFHPRWSPDGTTVAFTAYDFPHDRSDVRTVRADGTDLRTLVTDPVLGSCGSPAWSPDGEMIVFECGASGESRLEAAIYLANADGSQVRRVTGGSSPAWSPDGKTLAFERAIRTAPERTQFDLFTIALDGSHEARLTSTEAYDERHPSWSPDGAEITFDRSERPDPASPEGPIGPEYVFVLERDGSGQRQVMPEGPALGNSPQWITDDLIIFAAYGYADEDTGIGVVFATGSEVTLIRGPYGDFDLLIR